MIPFQLVRRLSHGRISARLELSREMEVKSDGMEEVMDGRLEINDVAQKGQELTFGAARGAEEGSVELSGRE